MYEMASYYGGYQMSYANNNGFDLSQFSLVSHPLNLINTPPVNPINPVLGVPQALMRPINADSQRSNLGFQMNPVSKNKKK